MLWFPLLFLGLVAFQSGLTVSQQDQNKSNACGSCTYDPAKYWGGWWTTVEVASTTSITAITVVIVSNTNDTVSTSTIYNFPSSATVPLTNSAGYPIYAKTINISPSPITTTLTWPTGYVSYQSGETWSGEIPASAMLDGLLSNSKGRYMNLTSTGFKGSNSTSAACSTAVTAQFSQYPTPIPPAFPTPASSPLAGPPFPALGRVSWWQWMFFDSADPSVGCEPIYDRNVFLDYAAALPAFPVYQYCLPPIYSECPALALQGVAYLTTTSYRRGTDDQEQTEDTPGAATSATGAGRESATPAANLPIDTNTLVRSLMTSETRLTLTSDGRSRNQAPAVESESLERTPAVVSTEGNAKPASSFHGLVPPTSVVGATTVTRGYGQEIYGPDVPEIAATTVSEPHTDRELGLAAAFPGQSEQTGKPVYTIAGSGNNWRLSEGTYLLAQPEESNREGKGTYLIGSSWVKGRLIKTTYLVEDPGTARQQNPATYLIASPVTNGEISEVAYAISGSGAGILQGEATFVISDSEAHGQPTDGIYQHADSVKTRAKGEARITYTMTSSGAGRQQVVGQITHATIDSNTAWQQGDGGSGSSNTGSSGASDKFSGPETSRGGPLHGIESSGAIGSSMEGGSASIGATVSTSIFIPLFTVLIPLF